MEEKKETPVNNPISTQAAVAEGEGAASSPAVVPVVAVEARPTAVQDIIAHLPAEIADPFETVCNHFTNTLRQIFKLHGNVSIHLDEKLVAHITRNKFSQWSNADKASFLTALLPRKRMNEKLKPAAAELLKLAGNECESSYVQLLSNMILAFVEKGSLSTDALTKHPALLKFEKDMNSHFSSSTPITTLLPDQLLFLSEKAQKEVIPTGISSISSFTFKDDYSIPTEEERYTSYGVTKNESHISTPQIGTPPISASASIRRSSSLFIPSSLLTQTQKIAPSRVPNTSARGFRKEGKVKMMEIDEAEAAADMRKQAENNFKSERESLKAEKEAAREARTRDAEEKRLKKQIIEEERKAKAAEREVKKRKTQEGLDSAQSSKQVRLDIDEEESKQQLNQASSATDLSPFSNHPQSTSALSEAPPFNLQSTSDVSSQVNFQLAQVLDGASELSEQGIETISLFLQGQYAIEKDKKLEFKLTERIYMDDDGVTRKREQFFIVLDYESCKWRKIKRTKKV